MAELSDRQADDLSEQTDDLSEQTDGLGRHAVSGVIWSLAQSGGGRVISMVVFIVLGRLLTPKDFGLISLGAILIEFGGLLTVSGLHRAVVQRRTLEREHLDAAFWSSVAIGGALCAAVMVGAGGIATVLGDSEYEPILRVLSLNFVITALGAIPTAILHRGLEFKALALRQLLAITIAGGVAVTVAVLGGGAWALVAQSLVSALVGTVIVWSRARWTPRFRFSRRHWKEVAGFGVTSLSIDALNLLKNRLDDLLIGLLLGATALGYFGVAYRTYAIAMEVVTHSFNAVAFPLFARIAGDRERAGRAFLSTVSVSVCITLPIYVGLAVLAGPAIIGLFGDQWGPSVDSLRLLSAAAAVAVGVNFSREIVLAAGRVRLELVKTLGATVVLGAGFAVGVRWGIEGVAAARVGVAAIFVPIELMILRRVIDVDLRRWMRLVIRPVPACVVMAGSLWALIEVFEPAPTIPWLATLSVAGLVVYLITLRITASGAVADARGLLSSRRAQPGGPQAESARTATSS